MEENLTAIPAKRIHSIDILRGVVMIIMALDHTRDFFHTSAFVYDPLDLTQTSVPIFISRWITHFCAPIFVFLAGTSAFLTLERKGKKELSGFLFKRGVWLLIAEITLINFGLFFTQITTFIMLQVIWAIGISMIALSVLIYLPKRVLLVIGLAIIFFHNVLDVFEVTGDSARAILWSALHQQNLLQFGNFRLLIAYPVLPWIGIMLTGYCFGQLYTSFNEERRKRLLMMIGGGAIVLFLVIRFINGYGNPQRWYEQKNTLFTILSFLNTQKYPPSLLYTLMTLGPGILLLAFIEKPLNKLSSVFAVYGRVPMFYYILHFYFIHVAFVLVGVVKGASLSAASNSSIFSPLPGFGFRLVGVFGVWLTIVALLYPLCKWYDKYKARNRHKWWLSYI